MLENSDGAKATPGFTGALATPEDDYDPRWIEYNRAHPNQFRSVGAEATGDGGAGDDGGGDGDGAGDDGGGADGSGDAAVDDQSDGGDTRRSGDHFSDGYADDVKAIASRYNTEADMAKALKDANTELSQRLKVPGKDADDKTKTAFRKAMGVPADIKGYDIKKPNHMTDEQFSAPETQDMLAQVVTAMHETGASKTVVNGTLSAYWAVREAEAAAVTKNDKEASESAEAFLRKEWGKNHEANMAHANETAERFPDLAQLELRDGTLVGSSPYFALLLSEMGRMTSEGGVQAGFINSEAGVDTKARFDELTEEISMAFNSGEKAKAQRLDIERQKLSGKLFGNKPISGQQM